jgi:hypothetical protein
MAYLTDGHVGVDLTAIFAGTGTSNDEGSPFTIGERAFGNDGTEWMYIHCATALTQYDAVGVDENYEASALTKAMADDGWQIGFAQVAMSDNDFGWICMGGSNQKFRSAGSCAADVSLYTTATAGVLDDTSASQTVVSGVTAVTANGTTAVTALEFIGRAVAVQTAA